MKKITVLILCLMLSGSLCFAKTQTKSVSAKVYSGIANYKKANYTGCIQDMESALKSNPNDILAKYYLALVYTKIGLKDEAKKYYQEVINQGSEKLLVDYAKKATTCLDNPEDKLCKIKIDKDNEMDEFIESGQFLHPDLVKSMQKRELKDLKENFNANKLPNMDDYRFINDAKDEVPTDAQIAAAVKVLAKVGYNPAAQVYNNSYISPQMAQLGMLTNTQNTNNNFVNLLPYLMAQKNGNSNISPELIQTMLLNQSMAGLDFGNNNN